MLGKTQADIYRKRQRTNAILWGVFLLLLTWVSTLFYQETQQRKHTIEQLSAVDKITIQRAKNTLVLHKKNAQWFVQTPYHSQASTAVIETLLAKLQSTCRQLPDTDLAQTLTFFATLQMDDRSYQVGELNTAADAVYIKQRGQADGLYLCDKLIASIALAPALNFIDKHLYRGALSAIRGSFGRITDFADMDMSVLEVATANTAQTQIAAISTLVFISDQGEFHYRVLPPTDDNQHLLLFEPQKQLIYAIAAHPKLLAILGL